MHIKQIDISHIPPIDFASFHCDEHVNLFIGPNGSGKSTILRAITDLHSLAPAPLDADIECPVYGYEMRTDLIFELTASGRGARETNGSRRTLWDMVPFLYIPATRVNLPPPNVFDQTFNLPDPYTGPDLSWDVVFDRHFGVPVGIFNGEYAEDAIEYLRATVRTNRSQQTEFRKALEFGYSCARSICPEVIHDDVPHTYIELRDEDTVEDWEDEHQGWLGYHKAGRIPHYGMGVVTNDDILGEPLYAGALSSGTQGTLLWIYALTLKMAHHYNWEEGWDKKPAILLIDEIENHLHPTWQRRVIPALLDHFPGLQIFATTHSPFVVAGLKTGQVHLLKRDPENGVVTATTNDRDVIGWTADEILRNMMGVDEPTDQLTVDRANRLRWLREKGTLSPEEESELNELRRQVNADFLNKVGPLESQRERYAELMQRFLASRQFDLTQDGK